jgi:hypothetical protein
MHWQVGDSFACKGDRAAVRPDQAHQHVKACRLPGAVGSQQADHFTRVYLQADPVDDVSLAVSFKQSFSR